MTLYKATPNGNEPLTPQEEAEVLATWARTEAESRVPKQVTMRQARVALSRAGLLASVNAAVAAADDETKITWEFAQEVKRHSPYIAAIGGLLGLTDQEIDELFITAAGL